jgi:hypothetical protein
MFGLSQSRVFFVSNFITFLQKSKMEWDGEGGGELDG